VVYGFNVLFHFTLFPIDLFSFYQGVSMNPLNAKPLTIYLASSFKYKKQIGTVYEELTARRHKIPDVWWNIDSKQVDETDNFWYNKSETKAIASRHFEAIKKSDCLILVCPITNPGQFNGANVEVGYALALSKPVYSFGFIGRSAMYTNVIRCYNMESLLRCLDIQALSER
jgi:nucleoside 2-deoxyribosyltransferase